MVRGAENSIEYVPLISETSASTLSLNTMPSGVSVPSSETLEISGISYQFALASGTYTFTTVRVRPVSACVTDNFDTSVFVIKPNATSSLRSLMVGVSGPCESTVNEIVP